MIAKRTKQKITFLVKYIYKMYLDFLFSVHTIQKKNEKKKTKLLKNIFNTNKLNIRHSKQMCDLLEDSFAQSAY